MDKLLYKIPEAAEQLSLCRASVYKLIKAGKLKTVNVYGTKIARAELERFVLQSGADLKWR